MVWLFYLKGRTVWKYWYFFYRFYIFAHHLRDSSFLIGRPTFIGIYKKKTVEQYSPIPYLATFVNCMLWVVYGMPFIHPHSILVVTINGAGFFIELLFLILFVIYSDKKKRIKIWLYISALIILIIFDSLLLDYSRIQ